MRNGTYIGLSLGKHFVPCNPSSYWGAGQDRRDNAIRRAQSIATTEALETVINSDIRTRFCRKVARVFMEAADAIMFIRGHRSLTREENSRLDELLAYHRYYQERYCYFLDKLDRSAERELDRHFWYYDDDTGEVVDEDTGKRYRPYEK